MTFSAEKLQQHLQSLTDSKHFLIAYSGGLDSHVLLHAMVQLPNFSIKAIHINHQLNSQSKAWALHCQKTCENMHVSCHIETVTIDLKPGDSLEEQARLARYTVFKKQVGSYVLLTAHTLNDQAETFLLQALRGAGLKGLSAMPVQKSLGFGIHLRPLLSFSRDELAAYAMENHLQWVEDDSNVDTRFDRNFLRHDIFPLLKKRWPAVEKNFARTARLSAEHERVIAEVVKLDFEMVKTNDIMKINFRKLLLFSDAQQRLVLRHWLALNQMRMPSEKQLQHIQQDVLCAGPNADPCFYLDGVTMQRDRDHLYLVR